MNILVVGSVAYDSVMTPTGRREQQLGGSATYFSVAASYFSDVGIVAVVGSDFSQADCDLLESRGVDLSGLEFADGCTFRWSGEYADDMNTAITRDTQLNVFENFKPNLTEEQSLSPYLFLANINPTLQHGVLDAMAAKPRMVACDTMNLWIDIARPELARLLSRTDALLINEAEARQFTGETQLPRAAQKLLQNGMESLVIKRGEYGVVLFQRDFTFAAPAIPVVDVIDPTGAGDSFAGGFMGYVSAAGDTGPATIRRAAIVGSVMASFTVEAFGLERLAALSADVIRQRFDEFIELTRFDPQDGGCGLPIRTNTN